jgi:hypothetical protein
MARVSSSSLLKNLEMESFRTRRSLLGRRGGVGCNFLAWCWVPPDAGWLSGKQFWNADQVKGNQIEQEVGGDASDATMFGLAHGHAACPIQKCARPRPARLRHAISRMPRGPFVDGAVAGLAGFGGGQILQRYRIR